MKILGIDPGTANVGFGVLEFDARKKFVKIVDCGCLKTTKFQKPEERLDIIYSYICEIAQKHKPEVLAVEDIFFARNQKTAFLISQAKGVVMLAAHKNKMEVVEVTPLQIKQGIVGFGRAKKTQVQQMLKKELKLEKIPTPTHTADALACAFVGFLLYNQKKLYNLGRGK